MKETRFTRNLAGSKNSSISLKAGTKTFPERLKNKILRTET
jgi:hypothetical protein